MTRKIPLLPTLLVAAAAVTMVYLGVWQWNKRALKESLIARHVAAQEMSAEVPWSRTSEELESSLFRWSHFTCERVLAVRSGAGTSVSGEPGWAHTARCVINGGGEAEVAIGWSKEPTPPRWSGGLVKGIIAPSGVLYASMPTAGLKPLAPPDPNAVATTPFGHLLYAIQWFFFALAAVVIYVLALRKRWREPLK